MKKLNEMIQATTEDSEEMESILSGMETFVNATPEDMTPEDITAAQESVSRLQAFLQPTEEEEDTEEKEYGEEAPSKNRGLEEVLRGVKNSKRV